MSEPAPGGAVPAATGRPTPRPPAPVTPRRPRAPEQRGGDLVPPVTPEQLSRRKFTWLGVTAFFMAMGGCTVKFFFPRGGTLTEPKTTFKIGSKDDYGFGVDDKYQQKYRIWVCRDTTKLYVIYARCTHLGCTPNWDPSANKFKCPCHGSGYDSAGVNFEGPAPKPMQRAHVETAADGQIVVDVLRLYDEDRWGEPGVSIAV